jgi:hypothetical protein
LSKACACRDFADDRKLHVSSQHYKAALLLDEVDRVNLEITDIENANRIDEHYRLNKNKVNLQEKKLTH